MRSQIEKIKKYSSITLKSKTQKKTWHEDYRNSSYIIIQRLPYSLKEKDIIKIFSQYGEIIDINLKRDKKTGESLGYAFLCYEDQRSTDMSIDNFNGICIKGCYIKVDHVKNYFFHREYIFCKKEERDKDIGEGNGSFFGEGRREIRNSRFDEKNKVFKRDNDDRYFGKDNYGYEKKSFKINEENLALNNVNEKNELKIIDENNDQKNILNKKEIEKNIFFATGPDGRGWAEDRDFNKEEFLFIEAQKKSFLTNNLEDLKKKEVYKQKTIRKIFENKNELWDKAFLKTINRMQNPDISVLKDKLKIIEQRKKLIKKKNKLRK